MTHRVLIQLVPASQRFKHPDYEINFLMLLADYILTISDPLVQYRILFRSSSFTSLTLSFPSSSSPRPFVRYAERYLFIIIVGEKYILHLRSSFACWIWKKLMSDNNLGRGSHSERLDVVVDKQTVDSLRLRAFLAVNPDAPQNTSPDEATLCKFERDLLSRMETIIQNIRTR